MAIQIEELLNLPIEERRVLVHTFPYKVLYRIKPDLILIFALIHTLRSSKFIKTKLK